VNQDQSLINSLWKIVRKVFISTFVIITFLSYALHERLQAVTTNQVAQADPPSAPPTQPAVAAVPPQSNDPNPTSQPSVFQPQQPVLPTPLPTDPPTTQGQYKNGEYVGAEVDAFYGLVQVKATIQNGQIASVDFVEFPTDRRTSRQINSQAVPWLKTEALQAQSAHVNIISGATLTSEAFIMSLQSALNSAKG